MTSDGEQMERMRRRWQPSCQRLLRQPPTGPHGKEWRSTTERLRRRSSGRRSKRPKAKVRIGDFEIPFNKEATRCGWAYGWTASSSLMSTTPPDSRRLRRLIGQMGLSPENCRKAMTACIQSVAMFGAELRWKGENTRGTVGRANELRLWSLVSRTSHLYHSNLPIHTSSLTLYKT